MKQFRMDYKSPRALYTPQERLAYLRKKFYTQPEAHTPKWCIEQVKTILALAPTDTELRRAAMAFVMGMRAHKKAQPTEAQAPKNTIIHKPKTRLLRPARD